MLAAMIDTQYPFYQKDPSPSVPASISPGCKLNYKLYRAKILEKAFLMIFLQGIPVGAGKGMGTVLKNFLKFW
jgi:hypothetical protein